MARVADALFVRSFAWAAIGATAGLAVGVVLTDFVWVKMARWLVEGHVAEYLTEQEVLASKALRAGDYRRAARHHINAAEAQSGVGFSGVRRSRSTSWLDWSTSTWSMLPTLMELDPYETATPKYDDVHRRIEAQYRVKAAIAFEQAGEADRAELEWERVLELHPNWTLQEHRDFAVQTAERWDPDFERATLESRTWDEYADALAAIRKKAGLDF